MPATPPQTPQLRFDWQEWLPYLVECEGSDDDKRQLIETMWAIARTFVRYGW